MLELLQIVLKARFRSFKHTEIQSEKKALSASPWLVTVAPRGAMRRQSDEIFSKKKKCCEA